MGSLFLFVFYPQERTHSRLTCLIGIPINWFYHCWINQGSTSPDAANRNDRCGINSHDWHGRNVISGHRRNDTANHWNLRREVRRETTRNRSISPVIAASTARLGVAPDGWRSSITPSRRLGGAFTAIQCGKSKQKHTYQK